MKKFIAFILICVLFSSLAIGSYASESTATSGLPENESILSLDVFDTESTPAGTESTPAGTESTPTGTESTPTGTESTPVQARGLLELLSFLLSGSNEFNARFYSANDNYLYVQTTNFGLDPIDQVIYSYQVFDSKNVQQYGVTRPENFIPVGIDNLNPPLWMGPGWYKCQMSMLVTEDGVQQKKSITIYNK